MVLIECFDSCYTTAKQGTAKPFWKPIGRRSLCTRRRKLPLMNQGCKIRRGTFLFWKAPRRHFLVYVAALRSNAPVTRIFSPRSFRVLQQARACTKGSGIYTAHRQHKRLPGSFSPQYRRCTVQCVPGPCRFARHAPSG